MCPKKQRRIRCCFFTFIQLNPVQFPKLERLCYAEIVKSNCFIRKATCLISVLLYGHLLDLGALTIHFESHRMRTDFRLKHLRLIPVDAKLKIS